MQQPQSSLPEAWVDRIFDKMALTYGQAWLSKWDGLDIAAVKADWGHELRGFQQSPQAIKYGLEHLPHDFPPTVLQFRDLCVKRSETIPRALPAPRADSQVVRQVVGAIKREPGFDPKAWAHRLREQEQSGARLTITCRQMWRAALGGEADRNGGSDDSQ